VTTGRSLGTRGGGEGIPCLRTNALSSVVSLLLKLFLFFLATLVKMQRDSNIAWSGLRRHPSEEFPFEASHTSTKQNRRQGRLAKTSPEPPPHQLLLLSFSPWLLGFLR